LYVLRNDFFYFTMHNSICQSLWALLPNPPCQLSLWEETGVPGGNSRLSAERWLFTLFTWGLGSSRIEKVLTKSSNLKQKCPYKLAMLDLSEERSIAKGHGSNLICPYKSTVLNRKDRSTLSRSHISTNITLALLTKSLYFLNKMNFLKSW
jgi:hypothetical protein